MKLAIVGRRNVGKSTFVNTLAETDRMIVSEVPGTTRDSVDVLFQLDGQTFIAIDTPGLRKRKSQRTDLEFYGMHRAQRSVRRADVVLMFFDAAETISKVDKQLMGYVMENHKPCIFVINKWDKLHGTVTTDRWVHYLRSQFPTLELRADRVHHWTNRQEREDAFEPRDDVVQAGTREGFHRCLESAHSGSNRGASATSLPESSSQNLLCDAGRCGAADDRVDV